MEAKEIMNNYKFNNIPNILYISDDDGKWYISLSSESSNFIKENNLPLIVQIINVYNNEVLWECELSPNCWVTYPEVRNSKVIVKLKNGFIIGKKLFDKYKYYDVINDVLPLYIYQNQLQNGLIVGAGEGSYGEWIEIVNQNISNCILVEGDTSAYNILKTQYPNLEVLNFCVDIEDSLKTFYLSPYGNVSSFIKENLLKYGVNETDIIESQVNSYSLNTLLSKYNIDWLRLDVEGLDYKLIKSIIPNNLNNLKYIQYEHINITEEEKIECNIYLESLGYKVFMVGIDMVALKN
jgi:FkbM family methyltransferase